MRLPVDFPRGARWAVPAGAAAVVAVAGTVSAITVAQAAPALPARTPAQVLAAVAGSTGAPPPLTGTVVETASLGIPQLPGAGDPTSITSLLSGSHTLKIWYADPQHVRLSAPVTMGESDLIRNGSTLWLWQSSSNSVTRVLLPADRPGWREETGPAVPLTPQQAARQVLAAVGKTTVVTTQANVTVAGQAAYQLVLAPKDSRSLVGRVTIAVDGAHPGVPLRVQVFARGAKAPALSVGYTSISFVQPAAANFRFTPPKGAHVTTVRGPGGWFGYGQVALPPMMRNGWSGVPPRGPFPPGVQISPGPGAHRTIKLPGGRTVTVPPGAHRTIKLPGGRTVLLPPRGPAFWACMPPPAFRKAVAQRVHAGVQIIPAPSAHAVKQRVRAGAQEAPASPKFAKLLPAHARANWIALCRDKRIAARISAVPPPFALGPRVIGQGWLSVLVLPQTALGGLGGGNAASAFGQAARSVAGNGGPVANSAIVAALLKAATPVHGTWGSGKLLHTSLISILITSNGRVLAGAVAPSVLYAAAAQVK